MVLSLERWVGKVAVVTGANSGIGEATAQKLVEAGIKVVGVDKNIDKIEENSKKLANEKGKLYAVQADLTKEEEILKALRWTSDNVGPLSILVNNAGVHIASSMLRGKTEEWRAVLDINLLGLSIAAREAIKIMTENDIAGHIVNICSINGHKIVKGLHMYTASKFGVKVITESFRLELNAENSKIKIGCVSPGAVLTGLTRDFVKNEEAQGNVVPILQPEDLANAIVYVLSTPPHVQIQELFVKPLGETFGD